MAIGHPRMESDTACGACADSVGPMFHLVCSTVPARLDIKSPSYADFDAVEGWNPMRLKGVLVVGFESKQSDEEEG